MNYTTLTSNSPVCAMDIAGNIVPLDKSVVSNMSQKQIDHLTQYIATIKTYEPGSNINPGFGTIPLNYVGNNAPMSYK